MIEKELNNEEFDIEKKEEANPFSEENFQQDKEPEIEGNEVDIQTETIENKLKKEIDTLKNQYIRMAADFDNYRKRQAQEREALLKYGCEDALKKLLPVIDTFDRAQKSLIDTENPEKVKESFDIVHKQFVDSLEKIGLKKIETIGQEFDPNKHEAVMQTSSNDHDDRTIINELQSGYIFGDRIIRPAMVNVAVNE